MSDTAVRTASVTIRAVTSRSDQRAFIDLPYRLYADSAYWVPPLRRDIKHTLDPSKNAFFEHGAIQGFIAEDQAGTVVGRVTGIVNGMHLEKYDDGVGFFGFFECVERYDVAEALLDAAAAWVRAQGLRHMRGPTNPSLNDTAGLLTDGFDREPSVLMPYNPPYYEDFLLRYGFERVMTMWAYYVHKKYVQVDKLRRGADLIKRRLPGLTVRPLDMSRFDEEARTILDIYNDAWSDNWGHVPMTENEFDQLAAEMKQVVDPNMVFIVEHEEEPVAFSITLPNLNLALKHNQSGRLFPTGLTKLLGYANFGGIYECRMPLMGVRKTYQGKAIDTLVVLNTIENGPPNGFDACELSWVLDTNERMKNQATSIGAVVDKQYGMFEVPVV